MRRPPCAHDIDVPCCGCKAEALQGAEQRLRSEQQRELAAELAAAKATIAQLVREAQQGAAAGGDGKERLKLVQQASQELARLGRSGKSAADEPAGAGPGAAAPVDLNSISAGDRVLLCTDTAGTAEACGEP